MPSLAEVDLSHNLLINVPSDSSYRNLNTHKNQNSFAYLSGLKVINLSNNHLRNIRSTLFSQNKHLWILDLASNGITEVEEMSFYNLVELVTLDISGNHLKKMSLSESPFDNGLMKHHWAISCTLSIFRGLTGLRTLNVSQKQCNVSVTNCFLWFDTTWDIGSCVEQHALPLTQYIQRPEKPDTFDNTGKSYTDHRIKHISIITRSDLHQLRRQPTRWSERQSVWCKL